MYAQPKIAMFYDADKTLLPEYMPDTLLRHFGDDVEGFWSEVKDLENHLLSEGVNFQNEALYTQVLLRKVRRRGDPLYRLSRDDLVQVGSDVGLFPGLPEYFGKLRDLVSSNDTYRAHGISIDFYVVSSGLADMLRGSSLSQAIPSDNMFGIEFSTNRNGVLDGIVHFMSFTEKTKFLYMVNKGVEIADINRRVDELDRDVPLRNFVYSGDGPTDVPCFSIVNNGGGVTFAVYMDDRSFHNSFWLRMNDRVTFSCVADYREGSDLFKKQSAVVDAIASRIVEARELRSSKGGFSPSH